MNIPDFYLEPADFKIDFADLQAIRLAVFVQEQGIAEDIEFDQLDAGCRHVLARDSNGRPIGTGRLAPDGKIGRMAVLPAWRGQGVGHGLLRSLIEQARRIGLPQVYANAQASALGFYGRFGFVAEGEPFMEAGIPHQTVRLALAPPAPTVRAYRPPRPASQAASDFDEPEALLSAAEHLVAGARRRLLIYSQDLEYALYGQKTLLEACKRFVLADKNSLLQIIVRDPSNLPGIGHPLLELAQRLPSHILLRAPVEREDLQYPSAYIANDGDGYLFRQLGNRCQGHWSPCLPAQNRRLSESFEAVWQRARPCTEFRPLGL